MMLALLAMAAFAVDIQAPPRTPQGHVLRVTMKPFTAGATARLGEMTIPFYERDGAGLALVPVPVTQSPGKQELQVSDGKGKPMGKVSFEVTDAKYPTQNIQATKAMKSLKAMPEEVETMRAFYNTVTPTAYWSEPFAAPTRECANSSFGVQRLHNGKPTGNYHRGLDLRSPAGTPVKATADGVVRVARMWERHGGTIGIDHGQGVTSHYLHLSKLAAEEGARVKKGDVVGYVGATGFATGPHLHWGVYIFGVPTDPRQFAPGIASCAPRPNTRKKR